MSINKRGCEKSPLKVKRTLSGMINIPVHRSANNQPNNLHEFTSVTSEKLDI